MLTYNLSKRENKSIYEYLYEQIKKDICMGVLNADEKLPSKRALSKQLGISVITIESTYGQLLAEGYIYSVPRSGFFVSKLDVVWDSKEKKSQKVEKPDNTSNNYSINFSGGTSIKNFPFDVWTKLLRETMAENRELLLTKSPSSGVFELREAIADYLFQFRGMKVSPNQIVIGAGTEYLYSLIVQLLGSNGIYAIEDPGYQKLAKIYNSLGVNYCPVNIDSEGMSMEGLKDSNARVIHISPAHHFPIGTVTTIGRRYELLNWANEDDNRYIIEDDYDSEFSMFGKPIPTLQSIDSKDKVIYFNTFSKSLTSTIRISYMVLPLSLMKLYNETLSFYSCTVSNFEQYALAKFINRGYFEKHINRMRNYYRSMRRNIFELLENYENKVEAIYEAHSGLHFLMEVKTKTSDEKFVAKAKKAGINISFLSEYYANPDKPKDHILLINYSGLDMDTLEDNFKSLFELI